MQKISTFLWFDSEAEDAARFYTSIFKNSKTDKFGLSWQVIPEGFLDYIMGDDEEGSQRAMQAMFGMKKLDLSELRKAYAGA